VASLSEFHNLATKRTSDVFAVNTPAAEPPPYSAAVHSHSRGGGNSKRLEHSAGALNGSSGASVRPSIAMWPKPPIHRTISKGWLGSI
jgi:hypothetical protein